VTPKHDVSYWAKLTVLLRFREAHRVRLGKFHRVLWNGSISGMRYPSRVREAASKDLDA
jgi:hypothetical protein